MWVHHVHISLAYIAKISLVSEPIALNLRQGSGNIYLRAQIFAGFMYMGAASCMWLLRAWKIGQVEKLASEQEKLPEEIDVLSAEGVAEFPSRSPSVVTSSFARRLIAWKRV